MADVTGVAVSAFALTVTNSSGKPGAKQGLSVVVSLTGQGIDLIRGLVHGMQNDRDIRSTVLMAVEAYFLEHPEELASFKDAIAYAINRKM